MSIKQIAFIYQNQMVISYLNKSSLYIFKIVFILLKQMVLIYLRNNPYIPKTNGSRVNIHAAVQSFCQHSGSPYEQSVFFIASVYIFNFDIHVYRISSVTYITEYELLLYDADMHINGTGSSTLSPSSVLFEFSSLTLFHYALSLFGILITSWLLSVFFCSVWSVSN